MTITNLSVVMTDNLGGRGVGKEKGEEREVREREGGDQGKTRVIDREREREA